MQFWDILVDPAWLGHSFSDCLPSWCLCRNLSLHATKCYRRLVSRRYCTCVNNRSYSSSLGTWEVRTFLLVNYANCKLPITPDRRTFPQRAFFAVCKVFFTKYLICPILVFCILKLYANIEKNVNGCSFYGVALLGNWYCILLHKWITKNYRKGQIECLEDSLLTKVNIG